MIKNQLLMKKNSGLFKFSRLLVALVVSAVFVSSSWALGPEEDEMLPPGELSTTKLMKLVKGLLEYRGPADAIPYLEEALVRLEGDDDEDVVGARIEVMYRLGLCYLETQQFLNAAELFQTFVESYPRNDYALVAPVLTLEALARSGDSVRMTAYIESLENRGEFDRLSVALKDPEHADACRHAMVALLEAYAQTANLDRFRQFLPFCDESVLLDMGLNWSLIDGGDLAMEEGRWLDALECYRLVKTADELMVGSERRLKAMKAELDQELKWVAIRDREAQQAERDADQQSYEMLLAECKAFDSERYTLDLMVRMAQCYDAMARQWLAIPVFRHLYTDFPDSHVAERCRFFAFSSLLGVHEYAQALGEGEAYTTHYPAGRFRDEVSLGMMHAQLGLKDLDAMDAHGHALLAQDPEHRYVDQVYYLLGTSQFQRGNYEAALSLYQTVATNWPDRLYAEESTYWVGMCTLFLGGFEEAAAMFEHYLNESDWSPKAFEEQVTYRLGVAYYGLEDDEKAETVFLGFLDRFPESDLVSEAYSMMGDLKGAKGLLDPALQYFEQARATAISSSQFDYAVFQAARVHELLDDYEGIIALMTDYLSSTEREGGRFAEAAGWLSQAWRMLGENGKALDACCETLVQYGNDPQAAGVDLLIHEILAAVRDPEQGSRLLFRAQGQLVSVREDALLDPGLKTLALNLTVLFADWSDDAKRADYEDSLLVETNFDAFAPLALLRFAEAAAARKQSDRVREACDYFEEHFDASGQALDMANIGIASLLEAEDPGAALALARTTLDLYSGEPATAFTHKLAGDALRLLGQYDEAVEFYSKLVSVRAWRGPLTPQALYWSAVCKQSQGDVEAAFTYYQRVYVLYGQYAEWVAKAYAGSVECLRALGREDELVRTWREMVANPDVAQTPEGRKAQAELDKLQEVAP